VDHSLNERARVATGVVSRCFVGLYAALMSSRHIYFMYNIRDMNEKNFYTTGHAGRFRSG
jgi:hypothetical protein